MNFSPVYIDMGRGSANPVVLSVVSNGDRVTRRWKIKINMINCNNLDMAPSGCMQYFRSPSAVVKSFNFGPRIEGRARYLSNLRYTSCVRVEENFCAIKWETDYPSAFSFGSPTECKYPILMLVRYRFNKRAPILTHHSLLASANATDIGSFTGSICNEDDFVGVDQGSIDGVTAGEDRFCGMKLAETNSIISKSKPFQLKVRSNSEQGSNAMNSQIGFALRYVQLPCVI